MSEPVLVDPRPQAQLHAGRRDDRRAARRRPRGAAGEIVALLGPSGSGKSTLLQAVGLLEGGFRGLDPAQRRGSGRARRRRAHPAAARPLGFVYQFHHLLPDFNAAENVVMPQLVRGAEPQAARERAEQLLGALGLAERLEPSAVASCRAASSSASRSPARSPTGRRWCSPTSRPAISTSIPPTSFSPNSWAWSAAKGSAALVATHNERIAAKMDRVVRLHEGRLE